MKHYLHLTIILVFTFIQLYGKNVDEAIAKKAATSFITSITGASRLKSGESLELLYKEVVPNALKSTSVSGFAPDNYFYVFGISKDKGFVIVSGDDRAVPILGYSCTSSFDPFNIPPNMKVWFEGYKNEMEYAFKNNLNATAEAVEKWHNLLDGEYKNTTAVVAPMIATHWDQVSPYNNMCPYDAISGENALAGCAAATIAQILRYWNYPAKGMGTNSYNSEKNPDFGVISADFENTQYNWSSMPNQISSPNEEISRLLFHCGVCINTQYEILDKGGSDAKTFYFNHPSVLLAFRKYFGYKHTNKYVAKSFYNTNSKWLEIIKAELDANRPVFYGADDDDEGGHNFVCDGYDSNNYLHFNWGWGGMSDGYFPTEAIDLGYRDYTSKQDAIIGIEPLTTNPVPNIQFNAKVSVSPSVYLKPGQAFSVTTDFKNFGAATFEGTFSADVYNSSGQWVGNIDNSNNYTLAGGENTGALTFSSNGISSLTSGTYFIAFWRNSTDLKLIESSLNEHGYYQMFKKITVSNNENPFTADEYENNNSENVSCEFIPDFASKSATTDIKANIHNTSDIDYYKLKLPTGYSYTVKATIIEDCQAALGYGVYPLDGKFSYKTKDGSWSAPEDLYTEFTYAGDDGYLYFKIEPAAAGNMGTYNISVNITQGKEIVSSIPELTESSVRVYPSPNDGHFTLNLGNKNNGRNEVAIYDICGKMVYNLLLENPHEVSKDISLDVPNGIYLVKVNNNNKSTTQKIIVNK
jgi:hypothetical protein